MPDLDARFFEGDPDFADAQRVDGVDIGATTFVVQANATCVLYVDVTAGATGARLVAANWTLVPISGGAVPGTVVAAVAWSAGVVRLTVTPLTNGATYLLKLA